MHNYFSEEKNKKRDKEQSCKKTKQLAHLKRKKQNDQALVKCFIRRTNMTLHKQLEGQKCVEKYFDPKYQPRKTHTDLHVGAPGFYYQDRSSVHRVNDALKKNQNLDDIPFFAKSSPSTHRFRENTTSKSIRFTPFNTTSRVMETVKSMKPNQVQSSWDLKLREYNKKSQGKSHRYSKDRQSRFILPALNVRTHPKTLESLKNKYQLGTLKNSTLDLKSKTIRLNKTNNKQNVPKKSALTKVKFSQSSHIEGQSSYGIKLF